MLASDQAGERASAAQAATAFIEKHGLTWADLIAGRAAPYGASRARHRIDPSDDDLKAAESRLRQMQAHNQSLERQIKMLRATIERLKQPK